MATMTSQRAVRRARRTELFKRYRHDREHLKILSVTGTTVVFRYGGYTIDFEFRDGRVTRGPQTSRYLSEEDWVFLFSLASDLMQAAMAGYKKNNVGRNTPPPDPTPARDPRQGRLL